MERHAQNQWMQNQWVMAAAAGAGAMFMYLFDPRTGTRRRALLRDRFMRSAHLAEEWIGKTWRDARNRGQGLLAEAGRGWRDKPESRDESGQSEGRFELWQENWSPTARTSVGLAGLSLAAYGITQRDIKGGALAGLGMAAFLRAFVNRPWKQITGVSAGHRAVDVNKTVHFAAPLENVFAFWARYAEFPQYTTHVREVLDQGEGRSRWRVVGPAGIETTWNAVITRFVPNREIAWKTEPDSIVQHAGKLKFRDNGDGTTTVHVKFTYNPPAGVIGDGVARLIGGDLKTLLEEDLLRIKTVLEEAVIPHDVQQRAS